MNATELDLTLSQFNAEVRNKDGEDCSRSFLLSLRFAIERFLNEPFYYRFLSLSSDAFTNSNRMLNAKLKELKKKGKENIHEEPISSEDLVVLKTGPVLQLTNPLSLLRNVWFHVVLYWCRTDSEGQRDLSISCFKFMTDERGNRYVAMAHN